MSDKEQVTKQKADMNELGTTGLHHASGHIFEERLKELDGPRRNEMFREMEDNDATVGAFLFVIDKLCRSVEWRVEPFSKDSGDIESAKFLETCMEDMEESWEEMISEAMSMVTFGHAPMEVVFKIRNGEQPFQIDKPAEERIASSRFNDGLIGWRKIPLRSQETIQRWKIADNGDIEGLWQLAPPVFQNVFIPIEKILLFRTSSRKNNPLGRSALRNAFRPWFFKKKIENLEGIGVERDLAGLPVAWGPPEIFSKNASADEKAIFNKLKEIATNVKNDEQAGMVFPLAYDDNGKKIYDFTLLTTAGSRQFKTNEIVNRYRHEIATTVVADFILMGQQSVGSFSLASSKTKIFSKALEAWLGVIAAQFNRRAIPMLFKLNGFDTSRLPQLTFGDVETTDLNDLSNYITALTGAGIDLTDDKSQNYLKSQANIPLDEQEGVE